MNKISYDIMGIESPLLPESLPKTLDWATRNAPEHMKPAILKSTFFVLYALICGVTLKTTAPLRSIRQFDCQQKKSFPYPVTKCPFLPIIYRERTINN